MSALIRSTVQYQIYEYNDSLKKWLWATQKIGNEQKARDDLEEMRQLYPTAKYRLVKIENTVTVLEGPAE